ncbi:MAG: hydroxyacylglutathione hydrolase [Hyphomicrobiaceae bacterium]|nr:hydroxyacylglutathione hydrolase [Hyphomicrobiaceae bacterium]
MPIEFAVVPCLSDNYAALIHDGDSGATAVVDAPDAGAILAALAERGWVLSDILVTHHHFDHVEGVAELVRRTGARVTGARADAGRIAGLDVLVGDGDVIEVGGLRLEVLETPGHTVGHIAYVAREPAAVFCGDTLFAMGCGRLFEGTPAQMWASLGRLAALAPETAVYCGHEYTQSNGRFALRVDPANAALTERMAEVDRLRAAGLPTVPSTMARELATNPFLRAGDPGIAAGLGMAGAAPVAVFAELRERKNKG